MKSVVELYNLALAFLGGNQLEHIQAENESSHAARLCKSLFPSVLDYCLSLHPWSFALTRSELARLDRDDGDWFQLPSDCVRPVRIIDGAQDGADFEIEGDALTTPGTSALLLYVKREAEPVRWTPPFVNLLATGLAAKLSPALNNDVKRQQLAEQMFLAEIHRAVPADLGRQKPPKRIGSWMSARHG
jgi:hypothetical protein